MAHAARCMPCEAVNVKLVDDGVVERVNVDVIVPVEDPEDGPRLSTVGTGALPDSPAVAAPTRGNPVSPRPSATA